MDRQKGFSLIELLVVIAILLTLAALAIPSLLRSKMSANESSAVASVRTIATAESSYAITYPTVGYADALSRLAPPPSSGTVDQNHAGLLDSVLGCASQPCLKSGYSFSIGNTSGTPVSAYRITAVPQLVDQTGRRGFCADQAPKITYDPNGGTACTQVLE